MFSSLFLYVKKRLTKKLFFLCTAFVSIIFLFAFQQAQANIVDPLDKERVEKFLKHIMIEDGAIYTLVGSKPMTSFALIPLIDDDEKKELYLSQTEQFRKYISFEKFKPTREDVRKLWNDWKKVESKYLGDQFLIVVDEKWEDGILINIPVVVFIFEKYYEDFANITGQSFDPKKAVYLIGKSSDPFWERIQNNHYLLGLLLGFGEKNARLFQWENDTKSRIPLRRGTSDSNSIRTGKGAHELTIEDLKIPGFVVYQPIDKQEERYKTEREKCQQIYKDADFCELTVGFLKGIQPQVQPKELSEKSKKLLEEQMYYNSRILFNR